MRLMITGRHVAVTPALREYVETRMERLDRYGLRLGTLQILLSLEKFHHVAEVVGVAVLLGILHEFGHGHRQR